MSNISWRALVLAISGALIGVLAVFTIDASQPLPVQAEVVQHFPGGAEVAWVNESGETHTVQVRMPEQYVGEETVPVVPIGLPYVNDGALWLGWYVIAALFGLFVAGPVAYYLRPRDYEEKPIRQVVTGAGV